MRGFHGEFGRAVITTHWREAAQPDMRGLPDGSGATDETSSVGQARVA